MTAYLSHVMTVYLSRVMTVDFSHVMTVDLSRVMTVYVSLVMTVYLSYATWIFTRVTIKDQPWRQKAKTFKRAKSMRDNDTDKLEYFNISQQIYSLGPRIYSEIHPLFFS